LEGTNVITEKSRIQYVVVAQQGLWKVRRDGKFYGPYPSRGAAMTIAINAAYMSGKNDRAAQVLVERDDGVLQAEWTYGLDPYLPHGASDRAINPQGSAAPPNWPTTEGWQKLVSSALAWSRSWAPF
jgi:hypothetical protein